MKNVRWIIRMWIYAAGITAVILLLTVTFIAFGGVGEGNSAFAAEGSSRTNALADGEERVFDQAGLFSETQRTELEEQIKDMRRDMNMDAVLVTTKDSEGKTAQNYAEDFYIQGNFGVGEDYSGVVFLIDMDNRELYLAPVGKMKRYLTDQRQSEILDAVYKGASEGDYMVCAQAALDGVSDYYNKGIPSNQYNYDQDTGEISVYRSIRWYEALLALAVALVAGGCACAAVTAQYAMKQQRMQSGNYLMSYRADCEFRFSESKDDLIDKRVTHVIIPKNHDSGGPSGGGGSFSGRTTSHSSSGRSFGGSGRKF